MKSILLSTIKVIVAHLLTLLSISIGGAILYMIFNMCSTLVAGQGFAAFNLAFFIQGFFLTLPFVFALSAAFVAFYSIRNKDISTVAMIVFSVIYMGLWIFIQPVVIKKGIQKASKSSYVIKREPLSSGYFRNVTDRYVFYYSSVDEENLASGVCMDKNGVSQNVYTFKDMELADTTAFFTDSLIQSSIDIPAVTKLAITGINRYIGVITFACSGKKMEWILFSSLGLALVSLVFMRGFSKWRFINVVSILSISIGIIAINVNMLSYGRLYFMTERVNSLFAFAPKNSNFLLFIVNVVLAAAFIVLGLIFTSRNMEDDARAGLNFGDDE
ncbi:hypothetical protein [Treponema sp.]|uniref:hypothetical protein n=1 Tax=Treponema sp. TaxID=166 RepID=UPI00388E5514